METGLNSVPSVLTKEIFEFNNMAAFYEVIKRTPSFQGQVSTEMTILVPPNESLKNLDFSRLSSVEADQFVAAHTILGKHTLEKLGLNEKVYWHAGSPDNNQGKSAINATRVGAMLFMDGIQVFKEGTLYLDGIKVSKEGSNIITKHIILHRIETALAPPDLLIKAARTSIGHVAQISMGMVLSAVMIILLA